MIRTLRFTAIMAACASVLAGCNDPSPADTAPAMAPPATSAPSAPSTAAALSPSARDNSVPTDAGGGGTPPDARNNPATPTARDSAGLDPKGTLDRNEESKAMPMAGHGNNHSSPSLEPPAKQ